MNIKHQLAAICILASALINAQNFKGQVIDQKRNNPIQEAHVLVNNKATTQTDSEGNFELTLPENGATITISYIGFKTISKYVEPNETRISFVLEEAPITISGVLVTGNLKTDPVFSV
ncbi:MAG: carboxypeptidase-like regulatory domain-containing protein, partial [Maribacter sp.]|nr:carboxypeptidase-like regulatory domain-containing protein [Maribacter sp.]